MSEVINAPWNRETVAALNAFQSSNGRFHPFTCPREGHQADLIATPDGWVCPQCDYTQMWAHAFMGAADPASSPSRPAPRDAEQVIGNDDEAVMQVIAAAVSDVAQANVDPQWVAAEAVAALSAAGYEIVEAQR